MKSLQTVIIEALVVGILLIPFTYLGAFLAQPILKKPMLPDVCNKWNEFYVMEINLLVAGFLFHFVLEYLGVNAWYAKNYFKR